MDVAARGGGKLLAHLSSRKTGEMGAPKRPPPSEYRRAKLRGCRP